MLTHSSLSQTNLSLYFEIKGYLGIYNGYYMTISANEFYLRALMKSIRSERSDLMRDITNTRKLLTRPKTTCQSKVSFTLCKRMIKHSSQAKNLPKERTMMCKHFSSGLSAFSIILSAFSLLIFFDKPRSNTRLPQGKRPSRVKPPPPSSSLFFSTSDYNRQTAYVRNCMQF